MDFCAKENIHRNKLLIIDHQVKVTYEMIKFSVIDLVIRWSIYKTGSFKSAKYDETLNHSINKNINILHLNYEMNSYQIAPLVQLFILVAK